MGRCPDTDIDPNLLSVTVPLSAFLRSINTRISQLERIPKGLQIKFSKIKQE